MSQLNVCLSLGDSENPHGIFILVEDGRSRGVLKEIDPHGESAPRWWLSEEEGKWHPHTTRSKEGNGWKLNRQPGFSDELIESIYLELFNITAEKALLE